MSALFSNINLMRDGPKIVLGLAAIGLWIACFTMNKKALDSLKTNNLDETKSQVEQLRNVVWALYAVYLIHYFIQVNKPFTGMLTSQTSVGVIGIVLTTILVLCITHVSNTCTDANCDWKNAEESLNRVNILLAILVVVNIGTFAVFFFTPKDQMGFTPEILALLRSPSMPSSLRSRRSNVMSDIDYD